jgi:hypothetical protein
LTAQSAVKPKREWRRFAPPFSFCSNSRYKNRFFESPPSEGFQKTDFGVSSVEDAGDTKIGFIMRIAALFGLILTNSLNQSYNSEFGIPKL